MRLLLIGPEVNSLDEVKNFSGVWAYYLHREFQRLGIDCVLSHPLHRSKLSTTQLIKRHETMPLDGIDHIIALGTRYFDKIPRECGEVLKKRIEAQGGKLCQIHDGYTKGSPVTATFAVRDDKWRFPKAGRWSNDNVYVGWAADPFLFPANQHSTKLTVLVDHAQLKGGSTFDFTRQVIEACRKLQDRRDLIQRFGFQQVVFRRIIDGQIDTFDPSKSFKFKPYDRISVPYPVMARELSHAHFFLPTHPESLGQCVLEVAMAGGLPVVGNGLVAMDRLATIRHVVYDNWRIPWVNTFEALDVATSRHVASHNSWLQVAGRMIRYLKRGIK